MKLIVPMARKFVKDSARFVPPSPLMSLVGRPILLRVLDVVKNIDVDEVIFIVDRDDSELKRLVSKNFKFKVRYVLQKYQKGVAHAIYGAKKFVKGGSCLVLFADSIIKTDIKVDLKSLGKLKADGVIWTKQVADPRDFGVVFTYDGFVSRLIEKPETPVSDLAMVGLYYVKNSDLLFESIAYLIKNKILNKGVYQLTDALQFMINKRAKIISKDVASWFDCGSKKSLLETHKYIIVEQKIKSLPKDNVFIKPVFIDKGASIHNSVIGPNVSVGKNANIVKSIISDTIVGDGAVVENNNLDSSLVGVQAKVYGSSKKINLRDRGVVRDE